MRVVAIPYVIMIPTGMNTIFFQTKLWKTFFFKKIFCALHMTNFGNNIDICFFFH